MRFDGGPRGHHRNALSGIGTHLKAWQGGIRRHRARARAEPTGRGWAAAVTFAEVARARYRREHEADAHRARPDPLGAGLPGRHQPADALRSEEHTSELQSRGHLVCRLLPEKKNNSWSIH